MRNKEQKRGTNCSVDRGHTRRASRHRSTGNKVSGVAWICLATRRSYRGGRILAVRIQNFCQLEPSPPPGILYSTRQHPIQGFTWSDFPAKPEHDYTYEVFALRGTPASPNEAEKVAVDIRTESEHGRTHHVHFNRGAAASQEYTRRFGDKRPEDVGPAAFTWLSRGAAESIANFIERAAGPGWGLCVAAYEFTDDKVLTALGAARDRGADVQVLYHAEDDEQRISNEAAIQQFNLENICQPRNPQGLTLSHNNHGADEGRHCSSSAYRLDQF